MANVVDILFPPDTHEGTESIVAKWIKKPGESVALHEPIVEISTDKVSMEVAAPAAGVVKTILKGENEQVKPGDILGQIECSGAAATQGSPAPQPEHSSSPKRSALEDVAEDSSRDLSPMVKRLLKEHGLSASQVIGSGRGGRITPEDVAATAKAMAPHGAPPSGLTSRSVQHTPMRRMVAKHMVDSLLHTAPHVTSVFEADFSQIIAHREKHKTAFEKKGIKLTFTAYFIAASVAALKAVPEVNSRWHNDHLEIIEPINIGVGTALGTGGLIVPVLKNAHTLDLSGIASALQDLTSRARDNKITSDEVQGGTFTISNHGVSGSLVATPIIINQPQSAILGVGKLEKRVKVSEIGGNETMIVRPCAYITLTIDHRVLDGFQANSFLSTFVSTLQEWR